MPFRIWKHWDTIEQMRQGVLVMVDIGEHDFTETVPEIPIEVHFLQGFINAEKTITTPEKFLAAVDDTKAEQLVLSINDIPKLAAEILDAGYEVAKEWGKLRAKKERKARAERLQLTDERQH